ncbi:MAG: DUF1428 domain-containing protein, partial [Actinobacteria bacterium]|nr:DUF1428 domain-containing protein [Actinomycetota bacterium]
MSYVDGFILPLKDGSLEQYRGLAEMFARKAHEHGAIGSLEAIGDGLESTSASRSRSANAALRSCPARASTTPAARARWKGATASVDHRTPTTARSASRSLARLSQYVASVRTV